MKPSFAIRSKNLRKYVELPLGAEAPDLHSGLAARLKPRPFKTVPIKTLFENIVRK
jgi:hypothetical protein